MVGPGSFTGIRIGISTIKGFCLAAGKPSLPVTSFETMAYNDVDGNKLLCLVDALHGRYYACGYETASYDGSPRLPAAALREIFPPSYLEEAEVLRLVSEETIFPARSNDSPLADKTQVRLLDPVAGLRDSILALMRSEENFGELKAVYIRKSQAERTARLIDVPASFASGCFRATEPRIRTSFLFRSVFPVRFGLLSNGKEKAEERSMIRILAFLIRERI